MNFNILKGNSLFIDSGNALLQMCKHGIKRFIWPDDLCHSVSVRWSQSRWKWFRKFEVKFQTFVIIFSSPQGGSSSRLLASCTLLVLFFLLSINLNSWSMMGWSVGFQTFLISKVTFSNSFLIRKEMLQCELVFLHVSQTIIKFSALQRFMKFCRNLQHTYYHCVLRNVSLFSCC